MSNGCGLVAVISLVSSGAFIIIESDSLASDCLHWSCFIAKSPSKC